MTFLTERVRRFLADRPSTKLPHGESFSMSFHEMLDRMKVSATKEEVINVMKKFGWEFDGVHLWSKKRERKERRETCHEAAAGVGGDDMAKTVYDFLQSKFVMDVVVKSAASTNVAIQGDELENLWKEYCKTFNIKVGDASSFQMCLMSAQSNPKVFECMEPVVNLDKFAKTRSGHRDLVMTKICELALNSKNNTKIPRVMTLDEALKRLKLTAYFKDALKNEGVFRSGHLQWRIRWDYILWDQNAAKAKAQQQPTSGNILSPATSASPPPISDTADDNGDTAEDSDGDNDDSHCDDPPTSPRRMDFPARQPADSGVAGSDNDVDDSEIVENNDDDDALTPPQLQSFIPVTIGGDPSDIHDILPITPSPPPAIVLDSAERILTPVEKAFRMACPNLEFDRILGGRALSEGHAFVFTIKTIEGVAGRVSTLEREVLGRIETLKNEEQVLRNELMMTVGNEMLALKEELQNLRDELKAVTAASSVSRRHQTAVPKKRDRQEEEKEDTNQQQQQQQPRPVVEEQSVPKKTKKWYQFW